MKILAAALLHLAVLFSIAPVWGATYWVAASGGTTGSSCSAVSGSSDPGVYLRTIAAGLACMSASDTLKVKPGTYTERITQNQVPSGSVGNPTTITSTSTMGAIIRPPNNTNDSTDFAVWLYRNSGAGLNYVTFEGFDIDAINVDNKGLLLGSPNNTDVILNSNIIVRNGRVRNVRGRETDSTGDCIATGRSSFVTISNMIVANCGQNDTSGHSHGVYLTGSNNLLELSDISQAIHGHGAHQFKQSGGDGNNIIRRNRIHDNGSRCAIIGSGDGNKFSENQCWNNAGDGIQISSSSPANNEVIKNTFYNNSGDCIEVGFSGQSSGPSGTIIKDNLCLANGNNVVKINTNSTGTVQARNTLSTDLSLVADAPGGNFIPRAGSSLIDAAQEIPSGYTVVGAAPDIGCCEFVPAAGSGGSVIYVDKDTACPGAGTSSNPYCSIQNALNHPKLLGGDRIKIRNAASPYDGATTPSGRDGIINNPIVIEPDAGHTPNITGRLTLLNVSYWTVQNLKWDACAVSVTSNYAIKVTPNTTSRSLTGITIHNNQIHCWGGTNQGGADGTGNNLTNSAAIRVDGASVAENAPGWSTQFTTAVITNNIITKPKEIGISIHHNSGSLVQGNDISGVRCGRHSVDYYRSATGISVAAGGKNNIIRSNKVHDWQTELDCHNATPNNPSTGPGANYTIIGAGVYCDVKSDGDLIELNEFWNATYNNSGLGIGEVWGVHWESRCSTATIRYNKVHNIQSDAGGGIKLSGNSCTGNVDNKILNNTIYNTTGYGIILGTAITRAVVKNNIIAVKNNANRVIHFNNMLSGDPCGGTVIDYNQYFSLQGGSPTWKWTGSFNANVTNNFATWKSLCSCDAHSIQADPLFTNPSSADFTLKPQSPAINKGTPIGVPYVGIAPDIGAEEFGSTTIPEAPVLSVIRRNQ